LKPRFQVLSVDGRLPQAFFGEPEREGGQPS
jgi:hypothetical protein